MSTGRTTGRKAERLVKVLLDRHGRTYADQAGIVLRDTPAPALPPAGPDHVALGAHPGRRGRSRCDRTLGVRPGHARKDEGIAAPSPRRGAGTGGIPTLR